MSSVDSPALQVLLGLDGAGRTEAWIADRPGCVVFAASESEAISGVPAAAAGYDELLRRWGLDGVWTAASGARPAVQTEVRILERVAVDEDVVHGNTAAFFRWDAEPATSQEIEATLTVLERSRQELLGILGGLKPDQWAQRPGGGHRTVEEIVRHVGSAEWWYMSRIVDFPVPEDGYPQDPEALLTWIRERVTSRLRSLTAEERARTTVPNPKSGERWTARKVLRRLIYHELYHIRQLRRAFPD